MLAHGLGGIGRPERFLGMGDVLTEVVDEAVGVVGELMLGPRDVFAHGLRNKATPN